MKDPIGVIILNFFRHEDSYVCIESVLNALHATVYLVDNSADKFEKEAIENKFRNKNDIKLIFPKENLGFGAGVNLALKHAIDDGFHRFLLLNNDAVLIEGAGQVLDRVFDQYPGSLIAPGIKWGEDICFNNYYHKYLGLISKKTPNQKKGWLAYFTGCALAFDINTVDTLGYFDESFFMYGEDVEISHRAKKKGIPMVLLKEILVNHEGSQSTKMASLFYEYHTARAHYLLSFYFFNHPVKTLLSLLGKSITLTARACIRSLRYHNFNPLIALFLAPIPLRIRPRCHKMFPNIKQIVY
jgi:N-acetylglucosaminyl-diphospho-decaprenol L-rhamnosyltransferase